MQYKMHTPTAKAAGDVIYQRECVIKRSANQNENNDIDTGRYTFGAMRRKNLS
jgi:hypothetical protein